MSFQASEKNILLFNIVCYAERMLQNTMLFFRCGANKYIFLRQPNIRHQYVFSMNAECYLVFASQKYWHLRADFLGSVHPCIQYGTILGLLSRICSPIIYCRCWVKVAGGILANRKLSTMNLGFLVTNSSQHCILKLTVRLLLVAQCYYLLLILLKVEAKVGFYRTQYFLCEVQQQSGAVSTLFYSSNKDYSSRNTICNLRFKNRSH